MATSRLQWPGPSVPGLLLARRSSVRRRRVFVVVATVALALLFTAVRMRTFSAGFWIDDGIAVGIASHPLGDIPSLLRQDGSPPLYYVLLHGWIALFGDSEGAVYALSLMFAVACVPVAWWAGRSLVGERAGWGCAALAASSPFLTLYAGQARMYTLVVLLSLVAAASFVQAFLLGRRRARWAFGVALVLLLYAHSWGLFFGVGCAVAVYPCWWLAEAGTARRRVLMDAALTFGLVGLAYLPWLPTLAYQATHTGAPWSIAPSRAELITLFAYTTGVGVVSPLVLAAAAGWAGAQRRGRPRELAVALVLATITAVTLLVGWKVARLTLTWAPRYVAVAVGPALLLLGPGLARAGVLGAVCLALTLLGWLPTAGGTVSAKSNVQQVLRRSEVHPRAGDLVLVTQPELVPVARYYLGPAPTYASTLGAVADPQVMDWRDAAGRLEATRATALPPLLARVPVGGRVLVLWPKGRPAAIRWQRRIALRTRQWLRVLRGDGRFRPVYYTARGHRLATLNAVQLLVLERRPDA